MRLSILTALLSLALLLGYAYDDVSLSSRSQLALGVDGSEYSSGYGAGDYTYDSSAGYDPNSDAGFGYSGNPSGSPTYDGGSGAGSGSGNASGGDGGYSGGGLNSDGTYTDGFGNTVGPGDEGIGNIAPPSYAEVGREAEISSNAGRSVTYDADRMMDINANYADFGSLMDTITDKTVGLPDASLNPDQNSQSITQSITVSVATDETEISLADIGLAKAKEALQTYVQVPDQYDVADEVTALEKAVEVGANLENSKKASSQPAEDRYSLEEAYNKVVDSIIENAGHTLQPDAEREVNRQANQSLNTIDKVSTAGASVAYDEINAIVDAENFAQWTAAAITREDAITTYVDLTQTDETRSTSLQKEVSLAEASWAQTSMMAATAYFDMRATMDERMENPTPETIGRYTEAEAEYNLMSLMSQEMDDKFSGLKAAYDEGDYKSFQESLNEFSKYSEMAAVAANDVSYEVVGATELNNSAQVGTGSGKTEAEKQFDNLNFDLAVTGVLNATNMVDDGVSERAISNTLSKAYEEGGIQGVIDKAAEIEAAAKAENPSASLSVSELETGRLGINVDISDGTNRTSATFNIGKSLSPSEAVPEAPADETGFFDRIANEIRDVIDFFDQWTNQ